MKSLAVLSLLVVFTLSLVDQARPTIMGTKEGRVKAECQKGCEGEYMGCFFPCYEKMEDFIGCMEECIKIPCIQECCARKGFKDC